VARPWRFAAEARPWTTAPALDSFRRVFEQQEFGRYFLNSLVVAGTEVIASVLIAFLAATAVTRFRFRFRTTLLIMFLVAQMVPVEALTIPLFFLMRDAGRVPRRGEPGEIPGADLFPARPAGVGGHERVFSAWNDLLFAKSFIAADGPAGLLQAGRAGLGRCDGRVDGDDDSGADLLRTRTATAGLGAGRSGKGLT